MQSIIGSCGWFLHIAGMIHYSFNQNFNGNMTQAIIMIHGANCPHFYLHKKRMDIAHIEV